MSAPPAALTARDRWLVPTTLWLSYLANDGEEWLTMARSLRGMAERLPRWMPTRSLAAQVDDVHVRTGIGVMGLLYGAAVLDGIRTAGRGWLFQDVQRVFGLHGLGHVAASLVTRSYTSGVLTSPTVVVPQLVWATGRLRRAGVPDVSSLRRGVAVTGLWLAAAHLVGHRVSVSARAGRSAGPGGFPSSPAAAGPSAPR